MKSIRLGEQGLEVSRIGLGCMGMSDFYGDRDDKESIATLNAALDAGVTLLDTADMYGPFKNEELIAKVLKQRRDSVVLATKFGNQRDASGKFLGVCGRAEYVQSACEASLKRLKIDTIDLYYQHRVDPTVPIEETVGAMKRLVEQGKVRYLGLSEAKPDTIERAHRVHPISALQTEYSLWSREPEERLLPTLRRLKIGFVAYSPLGRGFLTGEFKTPDDFPEGDYRRFSPRFQGENFFKNLKIVQRLEEMAAKQGVTTAQLALAWVLAQGNDIVPIPGTKKRRRLIENIESLKVKLSAQQLQELRRMAPTDEVVGARYADMSSVNH